MRQLPKTLKGFTTFVDGRGYLGRCTGGQPPKVTIKTEDHRDGGMDGTIALDMGIDKLDFEMTYAELDRDILKQVGRRGQPITLRGSQEDEGGQTEAVVIDLRGLVTEADPGSWAPAKQGETKLKGTADYYRLRIGGETIHEIDVLAGVRIIGGVDQLAERRKNLGG